MFIKNPNRFNASIKSTKTIQKTLPKLRKSLTYFLHLVRIERRLLNCISVINSIKLYQIDKKNICRYEQIERHDYLYCRNDSLVESEVVGMVG